MSIFQIGQIVAVLVLSCASFLAFGMQRTAIIISRRAGVSVKVSNLLLPSWFWMVWLLIAAKWGVLLFIAATWSTWIAGSLIALDFIFSAIAPIPHQFYMATFRRRIAHLRTIDPSAAEFTETLLSCSGIEKN
jgi:hypothetical protein